MSLLKKCLYFLLYSNLFVSFCVVALSIRTVLILDVGVNNNFLFFIFFSTLFIYHFQRLIRIKYKEYSSNNAIWNKSNIKLSIIVTFFSFFVCIVLALNLSSITLFFLIPLSAISVLYPLKINKFIKSGISLRELPFLKIFLISIVWAFTTTILVASNYLDWKNLIPIILDRFCFVMAITIPFDIRDLKFDNKRIKTIPMVFGVKGAKQLAYFLLFLSVNSAAYQFYFLGLNHQFFIICLFLEQIFLFHFL